MKADTTALHHETHGDSGPWITLLHGGLAASPTWDRQVRDLSPNLTDVARVLTLDLRGYGKSPRPEDDDFGIPSMARDVVALWDRLGIQASAVVGFSMGGFVAQALTLDHPSRVRALILVSTAAGLTPAGADAFARRADEIDRAGLARELDTHIANAFTDSFREQQPELLDQYTRHVAANDPEVVAASFRCLTEFDRSADLDRIDCPALVVCGELDGQLGPDAAGPLADRIPAAERVTIPDVGHTLQVENPNAFNGVVMDFLGRMEIA